MTLHGEPFVQLRFLVKIHVNLQELGSKKLPFLSLSSQVYGERYCPAFLILPTCMHKSIICWLRRHTTEYGVIKKEAILLSPVYDLSVV